MLRYKTIMKFCSWKMRIFFFISLFAVCALMPVLAGAEAGDNKETVSTNM